MTTETDWRHVYESLDPGEWEWLSNTHDPNVENWEQYIRRERNQSRAEARRLHIEWLKTGRLGPPKATEVHSSEKLAGWGLVGFYRRREQS